jgi:hypothetical protein
VLVVCIPFAHVEPQDLVDGGYAHACTFVPSHAPPHALPSVVHFGRVPCGWPVTGKHVPSWPVVSHASQLPLQIVLQQMPSTQKFPVGHWSSFAHVPPSAWRGAHFIVVTSQYEVLAHWLSFVHVVKHAPFAQMYGVQSVDIGWHVPMPSHCWPVAAFPLHTFAPHAVPAVASAPHFPVPSHLPSVPHEPPTPMGQLSLCGFVCAFAGPHVPSAVPDCLSDAAHARQEPVQVVSQQKPSTHCPVAHSAQPVTLQSLPAAVLHAAPCAFCG